MTLADDGAPVSQENFPTPISGGGTQSPVPAAPLDLGTAGTAPVLPAATIPTHPSLPTEPSLELCRNPLFLHFALLVGLGANPKQEEFLLPAPCFAVAPAAVAKGTSGEGTAWGLPWRAWQVRSSSHPASRMRSLGLCPPLALQTSPE